MAVELCDGEGVGAFGAVGLRAPTGFGAFSGGGTEHFSAESTASVGGRPNNASNASMLSTTLPSGASGAMPKVLSSDGHSCTMLESTSEHREPLGAGSSPHTTNTGPSEFSTRSPTLTDFRCRSVDSRLLTTGTSKVDRPAALHAG